MFIRLFLIGMLCGCVSGCSVATYSHKLEDYSGSDRVGMTFDNRNLDYIRVYPNTKECINLDASDNGYTNNAVGFQTKLNNKELGFPEIPESSPMKREFWVSAKGNIAVRMIAPNGVADTITFKPVIGNYYYVTGVLVSPYSSRHLTVYEVFKTDKGFYDRRPVTDLAIKNCKVFESRFQQF
ncbi:hypothetical protein [Dickeya zeae]|uniref:Lipoprotein n=1 Tax=Dickeya zeae TaxID=204042 RepID=A0ABX8VYF3_9GAMM|nr:hypothetical protein [Dickeya zeae]QYM91463.1 hypothetical protein FGI21_05990 [Dickeya zeae]